MVKMSMHVHGTIRNSVDGKATLEGNIAEIQEAILQKPLWRPMQANQEAKAKAMI